MKRIYEPGEMLQLACYQQNQNLWFPWEELGPSYKKTWAERESLFLKLFSQQRAEDEQTDDSAGVPSLQEGD